MNIGKSFNQQSPNSPSTQLPHWGESTPLPEFPPSADLIVTPVHITPPVVKEKQQVAKLPVVSPHITRTSLSHFPYSFIFFVVAALVIPSFFLGSFLLVRFWMEKQGVGVVPIPTITSSPSLPLPPEVLILLPWRISSAFIPLPPSSTPADLTKNWDSYINPTLRFSFKYPKEWFLTEFGDSSSSILKLSYPVRSNQVGSFAAGEKAYVLVLQEEKKSSTLEDLLSTKYNFSSIKKEEIEISGKKGWRIYNAKGKGEIVAFFEHGQKIISVEGGVRDLEELMIYQGLFLIIQSTFVLS